MTTNEFQKRVSRKPAQSEHCLQRAIVKWCNGLGAGLVQRRFFAVPNGGARGIIQAARLKAEGVRPGVPDLVFYGPAGTVLWLELKNGKAGNLSKAQKKVHGELRASGHNVVVARTFAAAVAEIGFFYRVAYRP